MNKRKGKWHYPWSALSPSSSFCLSSGFLRRNTVRVRKETLSSSSCGGVSYISGETLLPSSLQRFAYRPWRTSSSVLRKKNTGKTVWTRGEEEEYRENCMNTRGEEEEYSELYEETEAVKEEYSEHCMKKQTRWKNTEQTVWGRTIQWTLYEETETVKEEYSEHCTKKQTRWKEYENCLNTTRWGRIQSTLYEDTRGTSDKKNCASHKVNTWELRLAANCMKVIPMRLNSNSFCSRNDTNTTTFSCSHKFAWISSARDEHRPQFLTNKTCLLLFGMYKLFSGGSYNDGLWVSFTPFVVTFAYCNVYSKHVYE